MILTFFGKVENTKAEMDAKVNSKTCLEKAFSLFLSRFMRVKLQNFEKVLNRAKKNFFAKIDLGYQKTQNFMPSSNPLKKLQKSSPKKSYKPKTLTNSSKS